MSSHATCDVVVGNITYTVYAADNVIGKVLRSGIWWEDAYFQRMCSYITTGERGCIVDVGANIGAHSVRFCQKYPNAHVHAIEPHPEHAMLLRTNLQQNNVKNYTVHEACISNSCTKTYGTKYNGRQGNFGGTWFRNTPGEVNRKPWIDGVVEVTAMKLDAIDFGRRVTLMKVDVEGYELEVIASSMQTILRDGPVIFVEIWKHKFQIFVQSNVWKQLVDNGYTMKRISNEDYLLFR